MGMTCWVHTVGDRKRALIECKSVIPLVWVAFGPSVMPGVYVGTKPKPLSRVAALKRVREKLDFYAGLLPRLDVVEMGEPFFAKLERCRSAKIAVDVFELVDAFNRPILKAAIEAVRDADPNRSLVIPEERLHNPFTNEWFSRQERRYESTLEILMGACRTHPDDLKPRRRSSPAGCLFGHAS